MGFVRSIIAFVAALAGWLVLLPVLLAALPFWGVALLTRLAVRVFEPRATRWQEIIDYDPMVGWKPRGNVNSHCLAEPAGNVFHVVTGPDGWRGTAATDDADVIVFGDSYAFGYGVDDGACCFSERISGLRIKVIGSPGYSMAQEVLWMRRLAPSLRGKLICWFVYAGNDIHENIQPNGTLYRRAFARKAQHSGTWFIESAHVSPKPWPYNPEREVTEHHEMLRNTYGDTFISRRAYSAADFLLAEGRNTCDSTNARLVVITIPDILELTHAGIEKLRALSGTADFDPDMPHTRIGAACAELGIPFVNAKEFLTASHYNVGDRHWNPKGHREIAGLLRRLRDSYGVSLPVSESETVPVLRTLAVGRGFGASE